MNRTSRLPGPPPAAAHRPGLNDDAAEPEVPEAALPPAPARTLDPWTLLQPVIAGWPWVLVGALLGAIAGAVWNYVVTAVVTWPKAG